MLIPSEGVLYGNGTSTAVYTSEEMEEGLKDFFVECVAWNETSSEWSSEGIDNTETWLDLEKRVVHCYTCHFSTFQTASGHRRYTKKDRYDALEEFNALFFTSGLAFLCFVLMMVGYTLGIIKGEFSMVQPMDIEDTPDPNKIAGQIGKVQSIVPVDQVMKDERVFLSVDESNKNPSNPMNVTPNLDSSNLNESSHGHTD